VRIFSLVALGLVGLAYLGRNQLKSVIINTPDALGDKNVQALLATIRRFESGGSYNILYHCSRSDPLYDPTLPGYFSDYSTHPNIRIPFTNPATGRGDYSTAAGAYQITHPTWLGLYAAAVASGESPDFSPQWQDYFAVQLLRVSGALSLVMAGDIDGALQAASATWASLPYSTSGQPKQSVQIAINTYTQNGGSMA
jgi:muramidase (phage lysozyme)